MTMRVRFVTITIKFVRLNKGDETRFKFKIRLFLAFASYMGFLVYQMDVKSAFLYGEIEEEVYVTQPKGFEDPYFPKHVYRVVKALYGLHQAPRAWYERLSAFLLQHNYRRGFQGPNGTAYGEAHDIRAITTRI
ncbi:putative ribonuclease H-like domain-containing protein [Tanacetum coccineum]